MIRRRVIVHGLVQGVGYRFSCQMQAENLGVRGWARNRPDGTVEAVFEGDATAVEQMVTWTRRGPRHADVTRVDVAEERPEGLAGFDTY
ncbi:acylphosphatase [Georgenia sp. AZ-5]|uniref:acylphosphatase n=1 Tax=Georgenia sp. AZ-5 TaxID=3367526 RepID=UPI00375517E0